MSQIQKIKLMKAKILVQILIVAILGTSAIQAQETIDRKVRKDVRKAKLEIRKAKKDLKKNMKDIHLDAIHIDGDELEGIYFDGDWVGDEAIVICEDKLDHLQDILEDLDLDLEGLEFIDELEPLEHLYEFEPLEHFDFDYEFEMPEMPELYFHAPDYDVRMPEIYTYENFNSESGSMLELSKDLADVSISKDFYFDVKEGAETLDMNIDGTLESGDLTITVKKPDGEVFQKFQISPLADVDWSQNINLDEGGEVYSGKWTINLTGEGATGDYSLRFRAR